MKKDQDVEMPQAGPLPPLDWNFSQVFGERAAGEEIQEVDIISAIEFDKTGDHLATGDRGGRVVLFERIDSIKDDSHRREVENMDCSISRHPEFRYKTEFQSHEPEFDYLKSLEIEEKINKIRWCQSVNGAQVLLSTNDKTIKLWKVQEKKIKKISEMNVSPSKSMTNGTVGGSRVLTSPKVQITSGGSTDRTFNSLSNNLSLPFRGFASLRLPVLTYHETSLVARCRKAYAHAHDYHINSISNNSDGETFISADDLRINLWNLGNNSQCFTIVDVKPANMEDLTEVITSAEFHPSHCNILAYSSSKGLIRLIDMRVSALCDTHCKLFEEKEAHGSKSFFTDIIASISDVKFTKDGRHMLSRDYMTLKNCEHYQTSQTPYRLIIANINNSNVYVEAEMAAQFATFNGTCTDGLWDINMNSGPVSTFRVHDYLKPKLYDLYDNDSIFDKFECCVSGDGLRSATGSYSNRFRVFGCSEGSKEATTLEATKTPMRRQVQTPPRPMRSDATLPRALRRDNSSVDVNGAPFDFTTKLLHLAWQPTHNSLAIAASNSLYMYHA